MNDSFNLKEHITETRLTNLNLHEEEDYEQDSEETTKAYKTIKRSLLDCYEIIKDLKAKQIISIDVYQGVLHGIFEALKPLDKKTS